MATKTLSVVIAGDASGAQSAFKKVGDDADGLSGKLSGLGAKISPGMAAAAGAVVAGVGLMVRGAWQAAEESAKIGRETERVINTTGASAWTSADKVADYAEELSNLTGVDDEVIQSGENLLLTFTRVQNKVGEGNNVFDRATQAALDMSTALGTDMSGSAIQVGKALNDPIRGLTALSRAGVSFTEQQKDQIRTLTEAGDVLGAQKIILQELEKEFGGAAEAAATPFDKLKVQLGNLQEDIGTAFIPAISAAATAVSMFAAGFAALPGPIQGAVVGLAGLGAASAGVITVVAKLADVFAPALTAAKGALDTAALGAANLATKMGASQDKALSLATGISNLGSYAVPAIAGLTVAFTIFSIAQAGVEARQKLITTGAKAYSEALQAQTGAIGDNVNAVTAKKFAEGDLGDALAGTSANFKVLAEGIKTNEDNLDSWSNLAKDSSSAGEALKVSLEGAASGGNQFASELLRLKGEMDASKFSVLIRELEIVSTQYQQGEIDSATYKSALEGLGIQADGTATQTAGLAQSIRDASNALREATDPWFAAQSAQNRLAESQDKYNKAVQDFGDSSPEAVQAYRDLAQSGFDYEGKLLDLSAAQADGETSAEDLATRLQGLKTYGIDPSSEAAKLAGWSFLGLAGAAQVADDKNVSIPVSTPGLQLAIDKVNELGQAYRVLPVGVSGGAPSVFYQSVPGSAGGGGLQEGWNIVGENGPEPVWKSGATVDVYPNTKPVSGLAPMGGNSPMSIVINMPAGSNGEDVVEAIKRYERRNGTAWRN